MKLRKLYVYCANPIDTWAGWTPLRQLLQPQPLEGWWRSADEVMHRWVVAQGLALWVHWQGDIRGDTGPYVCPLPNDDCDSDYLIAWKQSNNGATFVASPFPLPWLDQNCPRAEGEYCDPPVKLIERESEQASDNVIPFSDPPEAA